MPDPARFNLGTLWSTALRIATQGRWRFDRFFEAVEAAGLPRTQEALRAVREPASAILRVIKTLEGRPGSYVPTSESIVDSPISYLRQYAYRVKVTGLDTTTGATVERHVIEEFNRAVPLNEAITSALASIVLDPEAYGVDPFAAEVTLVERSASAPGRVSEF